MKTLQIQLFKGANLNEICEKVQHYQNNFLGLISHGRAFPKRYVLQDKTNIFIYHTDKYIIVQKA